MSQGDFLFLLALRSELISFNIFLMWTLSYSSLGAELHPLWAPTNSLPPLALQLCFVCLLLQESNPI